MKKVSLLILIFTIVYSCDKASISNQGEGISLEGQEEWLIPRREIKDGGSGKDGIPSIDNPIFISDPVGLEDDDLVVGIYFEGEAKAYPHYILDWHEVVNDVVGNDPIALSYCPLTGTAFAWGRASENPEDTFGVSGLLYNSNLLMYDRKTESLWSQLKLQCVNGDLVSDIPSTYSVVETDWKTWKSMYPETLVLSEDTGYSRDYETYPYGDYRTNDNFLLFSPAPYDRRLPSKKRVYAIIDKTVSKAYLFEDFTGGKAILDTFNGKEYLIVGNEYVINSFVLSQENQELTFVYELSESGGFFKDNLGTVRSAFGDVVSANQGNIGDYFTPATSVVSFWFAIGAFYPDSEIYMP